MTLKTELNTPEMETRVLEAAQESISNNHELSAHFEHGQWWVGCHCGAYWSVVDATGGNSVDGFDFEPVSDGDEDYHQ